MNLSSTRCEKPSESRWSVPPRRRAKPRRKPSRRWRRGPIPRPPVMLKRKSATRTCDPSQLEAMSPCKLWTCVCFLIYSSWCFSLFLIAVIVYSKWSCYERVPPLVSTVHSCSPWKLITSSWPTWLTLLSPAFSQLKRQLSYSQVSKARVDSAPKWVASHRRRVACFGRFSHTVIHIWTGLFRNNPYLDLFIRIRSLFGRVKRNPVWGKLKYTSLFFENPPKERFSLHFYLTCCLKQ